jgi:RNA polymerase sigma-70 factor (ECF subfamily)
MDEQQAIARLKRGDLAGLETLVNLYQVQALHSAYLILGERALAEDVVQSAFLRASEKIHQFDERRPFRAWFLRIVINAALKTANRQKRLISLEDDSPARQRALVDWLTDPQPQPDEIVEIQETRQAVWQALEQLSPDQRAAIIARYYLGLNDQEMSEQLQRPLTTVKWWLHSARARLRNLLQPRRIVPQQHCQEPPQE